MRFFHLSDLHLGLKLRERDLLADQAAILEQITQYAKEHHKTISQVVLERLEFLQEKNKSN